MAYLLILVGILTRIATHFQNIDWLANITGFLPHLPNFAPIAAIALFSGVYLNKKWAIIVPVLAMFLSDILIGFYSPIIMASVYGSFILVGLIGLWLRRHKTLPNIIAGSLTGSVIFFLVTNFAMWAAQGAFPQAIYPQTWQGLLDCYIMGLPFFRNTIAGDLFYTGAFFGLMEVVVLISNQYKTKEWHVFTRVGRERVR